MKKFVFALILLGLLSGLSNAYMIKQSTSVVIPLGPFVDKTDGNTLETGLISALDNGTTGIMLSKNGGAVAVRHATVTATTYESMGIYLVTLDTTDTNTLGNLSIIFADNNTTALPVIMDLDVVPAGIYTAYYGSSTSTLTAENGTVLSVSESVSYADQFNNGFRLDVFTLATGNLVSSSCIVDSATGSPDTITTKEDISSFTTVGDIISIYPDKGCQVLRSTICDISASTSPTSFTVASCVDNEGNGITLGSDIFNKTIWRFITNGSTVCNVNGQSAYINDITSGGVITATTMSPIATPNTSNCGLYHP